MIRAILKGVINGFEDFYKVMLCFVIFFSVIYMIMIPFDFKGEGIDIALIILCAILILISRISIYIFTKILNCINKQK